MAQVEVVFNYEEIQGMLHDPTFRDELLALVEPNIRAAQAAAPKRTGAGAASIHAEAILDGGEWVVDVSWTRERYYMYFHERGTRYMHARPFLVPAFGDAPIGAGFA
jgi:HK97 gp10 family phage protein